MELNCPVKHYLWGKQGSSSLVAQLKKCSDVNFVVNENEMYAELWMGTHISGPALIKDSKMLLESWIKENLSCLGDTTSNEFGYDLPFLFKVLSVNLPLSIQVHPSKNEARELHIKYPDIYKDPNHKPELAIALSRFEALCGFRLIDEIKKFFALIPELYNLAGSSNVNELMKSNDCNSGSRLKKCYVSLMNSSEEVVKRQLELLIARLKSSSADIQTESLFKLLNVIHENFPGDVGCFCIYFFNYLILEPGDAIFLAANVPHAYIFGDCVECMACSDNVVRAGLTSKHRDVSTLCRILDYTCESGRTKLLIPKKENNCSITYKPPTREFAVCKIEIEPGQKYDLVVRKGPSVIIVIRGYGTLGDLELSTGRIFFVCAEEYHTIEVPKSNESLLLFQAFVNV